MTPRHVLVCYRASRRADAAVRAAAGLAAEAGARLTVLLPTGRPAQGPRCCGIQDAKWNEITESAFGDELARAAGLLDGSAGDVTFARVAGDSVAAAVTEYARREGCDLIALPARGLSPGNFGRRTERVLMAAGLGPVLRLPTN